MNNDKFYKLCKYYSRIKKSFYPLNTDKLINYLLHLKYHMYIGGSNTSQTDFDILNELVNELIKAIEANNNEFNNSTSLSTKLVANLEQKLKDFDKLYKLNQLNNNSSQEEIDKKNAEIKNKDDKIKELEVKNKIYFDILTKIKEIIEKTKQDKNTLSVLENEKNKIISDIEKLNKDFANKSERILSLQNKLADSEKNIADTDNTDNEKITELNKKSETLKNLIDRFELDAKNISSSIEEKQKEIVVLDEKIKLATDTNISDYKARINGIDYTDELTSIVGSIFSSLFETLYGKDIADKIIENSK